MGGSGHAPIDQAAFRDAMRRPSNAVAILAAGPPGARRGMTATSICTLSDVPPTILVCVNRQASVFATVRDTRAFSVNFLNVGQADLANVFAGRTGIAGEQRFDRGLWTRAATGAPVLEQCLVALDCVLDDEYSHVTHGIFVGTIVAVTGTSPGTGLMYGERRYLAAVPAEADL